MITCYLRYEIAPFKAKEFETYAKMWLPLVKKFGGTHHGYFLPEQTPASAAFSFPGLGEEGPSNVGIALFSFPTVEAYDSYRQRVAEDPVCEAVTKHFNETKCFLKYERTFMKQIAR